MPTSRFTGSDIFELATEFVRRTVTNLFTAALDISFGGTALAIGADNGLSTRTDATSKTGRFGAAHYTNAEEKTTIVTTVNNASGNFLFIGGGTGTLNAATEVRIYTAATTTTTTGTARMYIDTNGRVGVGVASPTATLHLKAGVATANGAPLKLTSGTNLTTPEAGAAEYSGRFTLTESDATRRFVVQAVNSTKTTAGAPFVNDGYITVTINGVNYKLMTTA